MRVQGGSHRSAPRVFWNGGSPSKGALHQLWKGLAAALLVGGLPLGSALAHFPHHLPSSCPHSSLKESGQLWLDAYLHQ